MARSRRPSGWPARKAPAVLALALLALPTLSSAQDDGSIRRGSGRDRCAAGEPARDRVARVEPGGDVVLASGGAVILADVRMSDALGAPIGPGRPGPIAWLVGAEVELLPLGAPDRWGRRTAILRLAGPASPTSRPVDVAELLVAEGLARVDPGERDELCRPDLLVLEGAARGHRLGIWAAGGEPLPAGEPERLRERAGHFVLVEGRVASVGERDARTYINFGRDFARDFAATVPKRNWDAMKRAGLSAAALTGKTVRVRGILEVRRAPSVEILSADLVEIVGPGRPSR